MTKKEASGTDAPRDNIPNIHNGTFTIAHPKRGGFTVKLHTVQSGDLAGKRILSLLVGPNNVTDYQGVAFWNDAKKCAHIWKAHRGSNSYMPLDGFHWQNRGWSRAEQKLAIWAELAIRGDNEAGRAGFCTKREGDLVVGDENYTLLLSGRCVVCNRKLTTPESIRSGIGPTCKSRQ